MEALMALRGVNLVTAMTIVAEIGEEEEMRKALAGWSLGVVVEALMALRGVNLVTAMTIVAEIGDMSRFESPRQLMAYLGLVPSEDSSGKQQKRGGITKTGNGHVRSTGRVFLELSDASA